MNRFPYYTDIMYFLPSAPLQSTQTPPLPPNGIYKIYKYIRYIFPMVSKSFLLKYQNFTSDASEDVEAALEERTCLPIHSFVLLCLVGQWISHLFKVLTGILQDGLGVVDGSNFQGGRGRTIVNRIIPSFLPHSLQFMFLWGSKVALSSVV